MLLTQYEFDTVLFNNRIFSPCNNCITLPMCINKKAETIIFCPLLDNLFYIESCKLKPNMPGTKVTEWSIILSMIPLHMSFWIQRNKWFQSQIYAIADDTIVFEQPKTITLYNPSKTIKLFNT